MEQHLGSYSYVGYTPHCCVCSGSYCGHTGGPYYCEMHKPTPSTWTVNTWPATDPEISKKLDEIIELLKKMTK